MLGGKKKGNNSGDDDGENNLDPKWMNKSATPNNVKHYQTSGIGDGSSSGKLLRQKIIVLLSTIIAGSKRKYFSAIYRLFSNIYSL